MTWKRLLPRENVIFVRIFMATTGILTVVAGAFLLGVGIWRLTHPFPTPLPIRPLFATLISFTFLISMLLRGVCWVMVSISERLWTNNS